ncbi:MAG TPA: GDP-mannose 4,6-dehydratase [Candidatus Eisenbacteria bacterium]|nr:GDP-mannose 4,6-dehydratase [Candidatus Eisenbacteria bacterium]
MRLLVTGVLGFAGRHLCEAAALAGYEVVGSGLEDPTRATGVEGLASYRVCDVRNLGQVEALYDALQPEAVVHLAAQSSGAVAFHDPPATFQVNAGGTLHVLEAARRKEFQGPILAVTSSEAYGRIPLGRPADESSPLRPVSPYGVSKAAADAAAQMYAIAYGLRAVRARSFAHTGPGQATEFVASAWAQQVAQAEAKAEAGERGPFVIKVGNLDPVRDLGDVRDVVGAYLDLLERGRSGEAYNVCTGQGLKLRDLLEALRNMSRVPLGIESDPARMRSVDIPYLVGDRKKIGVDVGWTPKRTLAETLESLLEHWRSRLGASRPAGERA